MNKQILKDIGINNQTIQRLEWNEKLYSDEVLYFFKEYIEQHHSEQLNGLITTINNEFDFNESDYGAIKQYSLSILFRQLLIEGKLNEILELDTTIDMPMDKKNELYDKVLKQYQKLVCSKEMPVDIPVLFYDNFYKYVSSFNILLKVMKANNQTGLNKLMYLRNETPLCSGFILELIKEYEKFNINSMLVPILLTLTSKNNIYEKFNTKEKAILLTCPLGTIFNVDSDSFYINDPDILLKRVREMEESLSHNMPTKKDFLERFFKNFPEKNYSRSEALGFLSKENYAISKLSALYLETKAFLNPFTQKTLDEEYEEMPIINSGKMERQRKYY